VITIFGYTFVGLSSVRLVMIAVAAAAFLTALYLLRERHRRVVVSFLPLWAEAIGTQRQERLGRRLRRWLSWLLQMTILLLVIVAVGDPQPAAAPPGGRSLLLLIDRSASMGARTDAGTRLEEAIEEARKTIDALGRHDRLLVASFARTVTPESAFEQDVARLEQALGRIDVAQEPADMSAALSFAQAVLRGRPHPEVLIISDGAYDPEALPDAGSPAALVVKTRRVGAPLDNLAIVGFSADRRVEDPGTAQATVTIQSFAVERMEAALEILDATDGALLVRTTLSLAPQERMSRSFSWIAGTESALEAVLRHLPSEADALAADDRAFAVLPENRRRRLLVSGPTNLYLDGALLSFGGTVAVDRVAPSTLEARRPDWPDYDAVIFDGVAPVPPPTAGRFIYLAPTGPGSPFRQRGVVRDPLPSDFMRGHPLLQHVSLVDLNIREAHRLVLEPGDEVVAQSFGTPLIATRARPGLKLVALSFDPRRSDLPLRPLFPLLLANAIDWLGGPASPAEEGVFRTGGVARVMLPPGSKNVVVRDPSGATTRWTAPDAVLELPLPLSGHYHLTTEGPKPQAFALAAGFFDPRESDLRRPASPAFERLAAPSPKMRVAGIGSVGLIGWALLAAVGLCLFEWWLFHRRWTV
jgi:hypothetical protein